MSVSVGLYSINDIKSFFLRKFCVGDTIETIIENGSESLRLQYEIVSLDRDGAICKFLLESWSLPNRQINTWYYEQNFKRFIHKDYFKHFKHV